MAGFGFFVLGVNFDEIEHRECVRTTSLKNATRRTSQRVKWISRPRIMINPFRSLHRSILRSIARSLKIFKSTYKYFKLLLTMVTITLEDRKFV